MYWLRYLLKEPYNSLHTPAGREFVGLLFKYGNSPRHKRTQVSFGKYQLTVPDTMSFLWQHKEIFADEFYYFETPNSAPVIFDCGANVGMSVLYFKKLYPNAKITAFEAEPEIASLLRNNLSANSIGDVEIVDKAVWTDEEGIWFGSESADSSSIYSTSAKKKIASIRLRDYLLAEKHIDFLKIDIEGAEKEVLNDCEDHLQHVQNLFVEFHSYVNNPQDLAAVITVFEKNGFRYYIDTNQHRLKPFTNHKYRGNEIMDLQLNIFGWRE
ncbi:FkbM family methyltransferase [Dyadobacter sp. Leaf189]|uniref:FkbM family methyltransferase n=1 Tax=Dyadobacter sp. Leaf189 TaxID=1736295 RepID=UPI0007004656|nr:FkbM family methyltransferase [Dyadobacter sp. Leaf189]KQS33440.1 FkbM family methyltransferase [Dyadobacter sp. Leaf189]